MDIKFYYWLYILVIGFYYQYIKVGILYQDPTTEIIQKYNRNIKIGEISTLVGFCIEMINIFLIITYVIVKKVKS